MSRKMARAPSVDLLRVKDLRAIFLQSGAKYLQLFACHSEESAILIGGRRGTSHCLENTQSEIPRCARNDMVDEVFTQTPHPWVRRLP